MKLNLKTLLFSVSMVFGLFLSADKALACGNFFIDSCFGGGYADYGMYTYQQYPYPVYTYNQTNSGNAPTSGQYNYVQYPYPVYTYNQSPAPRDPMADHRSTYVQYPYQVYNYAQNPGPRDPMADYNYNYYRYPERVYTYYNQSESSQLAQYQTNYQQPSYGGYNSYGGGGQGFMLTSGY